MRSSLKIFSIIFFLFWGSAVFSSQMTFHFGPTQIASGGNNPLNIPPSLTELEFVWVTDKKKEISFSIFPGIFYGFRKVSNNDFYFSLGAGLVTDSHSVGLGAYTAVGYDGFFFHPFWLENYQMSLNIEYKQALGLGRYMIVNSYALRIGTSLFF